MRNAAIVLAVLAVIGLGFQLLRSGPSDQELINEAVREAVNSSREGRPGGVMEYLSKSLTYNDIPVTNRTDVADFIRESRPDVVFDTTSARVQGDEATINTGAQISLRLGPVPLTQRVENVRIVLRKETGFRFLILPTPRWRITDIQVEGIDGSALSN